MKQSKYRTLLYVTFYFKTWCILIFILLSVIYKSYFVYSDIVWLLNQDTCQLRYKSWIVSTPFVKQFQTSLRRLQDAFQTFWSIPIYLSWPYLLKTSCKNVFKTYSIRFAKTPPRRLVKTSSRNLQDVFKTF